MLCALDPRQPVVDRVRRDRRRERSKVVWRPAGYSRELAETPVRQSGGASPRISEIEGAVPPPRPQITGLASAPLEPLAPRGGGVVERVRTRASRVGGA